MTVVGITGPSEGLSLTQERFVADTTLDFLLDHEPPVDEFVSGCAEFVDSIGVYAAERARVPSIVLTVPLVSKATRPGHILLPSNYESLRFYLEDGAGRAEARDNLFVARGTFSVLFGKPGKNASEGYMKRNDLTVSLIGELLAFPRTSEEERRSGTWAAIRRARKKRIPVHFFPLDGSSPWVEDGAGAGLLF